MADFPILLTKRLALRAFRPSDAPAVFAIFSRETVTRYVNRAAMHSMQEADELVAIRAGIWSRNAGARWAITLRGGDDTVIGSCGYYNVNRTDHSVEIGYDLHPAHWRNGIMTEAATAMLDYCFSDTFEFRLNRVEALTYVENVASIGLLVKLGFREEGIRRECAYFKNAYHDLRAFSLLRREWEGRLIVTGQPNQAAKDSVVAVVPPQRSGLRGWII